MEEIGIDSITPMFYVMLKKKKLNDLLDFIFRFKRSFLLNDIHIGILCFDKKFANNC